MRSERLKPGGLSPATDGWLKHETSAMVHFKFTMRKVSQGSTIAKVEKCKLFSPNHSEDVIFTIQGSKK